MSCSVMKIMRYDSRMNVCDVMLQTVRQERRILYKFVFSLIAGGVMYCCLHWCSSDFVSAFVPVAAVVEGAFAVEVDRRFDYAYQSPSYQQICRAQLSRSVAS